MAAASVVLMVVLLWYLVSMASTQATEVSSTPGTADTPELPSDTHVIMTTKSSRPGCEVNMQCYTPYLIQVSTGQEVVWENQDSAFHSVTSGMYGDPPYEFDSGHMEPTDRFSYVFAEPGTFVYHCTLHPWMDGIVEVT